MSISKYLDERLVVFLDVEDRNRAIHDMVDALNRTGKLRDPNIFHRAILEREKIVSTGIGMGVAIPHAKIDGYPDFFIAIGIQGKKGIEWQALDSFPVHLIFMIGGPEKSQAEYLHILSGLTTAIKDPERRKKLMRATRPAEVIQLFQDC